MKLKRDIRSLLVFGSILMAMVPLAQERIPTLEAQLKDQYGMEKLVTLVELATHYEGVDSKKCLKYARQGEQLSNNLLQSGLAISSEQYANIIEAKEIYGTVQYKRGKYLQAREALLEAQEYGREHNHEALAAETYLFKIDSLASLGVVKDNPIKQVFRDIKVDAAIKNSGNNVTVSLELNKAKMAEKKGNIDEAIAHYEKAAGILRLTKATARAEQIESKVRALQEMQSLNAEALGELALELPEYDTVEVVSLTPVRSTVSRDSALKDLEDIVARIGQTENYQEVLDYYDEYLALQSQLIEDSLHQQAQMQQANLEMERLRQENEIADLNIAAIQLEKQAEARLKNTLIIIVSFVVLATAIILFMYVSKRKKHQALTAAYTDLDQAKQELEEAESRISRLLAQQVSPEIASALIEEHPERKKQVVAVMFLDIRDFTPMAEQMEPAALIDYQNKVFGFMIDIIDQHNGNINQFMGDGFMATFGAPKSHGNDSRNAFLAAVGILEEIRRRNDSQYIPHTQVGIGLHCGEVVTGNVGTEHRKQFSVTGNAVIIAARVEQLNKSYNSNLIVTQEVASSLSREDLDNHVFQHFDVHVKGRQEPVSIHVLTEGGKPSTQEVPDRQESIDQQEGS